MELIKVENIIKTYHLGSSDVEVLKGVSLGIMSGEMVALMGASGSGKTTLMNILGCLDRPTSGQYLLDGQEISRMSVNQRAMVRNSKIGFVFQNFNLLPRLSALENVELPLLYASRHDAKALARKALGTVGLADRTHHEPNQLSGGQRQRVAIARALVTDPAIILADEPTGNLDSQVGRDILDLFHRLNQAGSTIIIVTHDHEVARHCGREVQLRDGRIVAQVTHASPKQPSTTKEATAAA